MKLLAMIAAVTLTACGADATAPTTSVVARPQLDATALAAHSLGINSLPGMRLLATQHGRDVLSRIVSCALPRGASITAINRNGTPYSFSGSDGLAPAWERRAATTSERQRVTACATARAPGLVRA